MTIPNSNENYEQWVESSRKYELELAQKKISNGEIPKSVMEKMSNRLIEKMLYPLYNMLKQEQDVEYNPELSQYQYNEYFKIKGLKPKADHIVDNK